MSRRPGRKSYATAYGRTCALIRANGTATVDDIVRLRTCSRKAAAAHISGARHHGYLTRVGHGVYALGPTACVSRLDLVRKCVTERGMIDADDLMRDLGITREAAHMQVKRAVAAGVLRRVRLGVFVVGEA